MEVEFTHGRMEEGTRENINKTKNMGLGFTHGPMEGDTREIGLMESNTGKASIFCQMDRSK